MEVSIFLLVFFSAIFTVQSLEYCPGDHTDIRFPFRIKGRLQSQHIGCHPSYELLCQSNTTIIHFPGFRDFVVKSISYDPKSRLISLIDPKNCVPEVFLNLNLSQTPFRYYHKTKEYKYLTCSEMVSGLEQVPCLSSIDENHHVYVVESSFELTPGAASSCKAFKSVNVPFAYNSYISDNSFGLELTWDLAYFEKGGYDDEAKPTGRSSETLFNGKVLLVVVAAGVAALVLMAGIAASVTSNYWLGESDKKKEHKLHEDCEKLLIEV